MKLKNPIRVHFFSRANDRFSFEPDSYRLGFFRRIFSWLRHKNERKKENHRVVVASTILYRCRIDLSCIKKNIYTTNTINSTSAVYGYNNIVVYMCARIESSKSNKPHVRV